MFARYLVAAALLCHITIQAQDKFRRIDSLLSTYESATGPGMSVGIVADGQLVYAKGFGLASVESQIKNTDQTLFSIASVAKQFTAACIWALIEKKQLSLDDDIRKYLPELPDYGTPIRIRHLLNHTSGIRNYHILMDLRGFDYDTEYYNNQTILGLAAMQRGVNNAPGAKILYSNTNYNLLAIIAERISGKTLDDFARRHILKPLNMNSTSVRTKAGEPANAATGYQVVNGDYITKTSTQESYGAGSMVSSIADLAKWVNVLNGRNAKFTSLAAFLSACDTLTGGDMAQYARGVMTDRYKGLSTISHSGYGWGGQSQIIALPQEKMGVVILTNLESIDPTPVSYQIIDLFLGTHKPTAAKTMAFDIPPGELTRFPGSYREINSDMKMEIYVERDTLWAKGAFSKKGIALVASAPDKFHRMGNESIRYDFSKSKNCDMVITFSGTPFYFNRAEFVNPAQVIASDFTGEYYSDELQATYLFHQDGNQLMLSYTNHKGVKLVPVGADEFGNNQRTLYQFRRDDQHTVNHMLLSAEGTVKDILFIRRKL